ncbi:MAG: recombinase family protein [Candidatus Methanogranum gryphiswaldense]|nr:MAG: recombinase family protein [Candidatus Methanogranum sp. U3.2.1]
MRAAIYVRVSTEEQALEGYSLDAQTSILKDYCISEDWEIESIYCDDGYSGTNVKRPAYQRMMSEFDKWDVILVLKMDRIHRNSRNFMNMMDELNKQDKKFVSCMESLDTTNALGRFVVDMIQRLAQLESEQIGERTYMGMKEKAETLHNSPDVNKTLGFNPPYGYDMVDGILFSVPEEIEVVGSIFHSYSEGSTLDKISFDLNRNGTLTRHGNPWNTYNLRNILHNPIYAGYMRWDDILIRHFTQIAVNPQEYNCVQRLMASKVQDPKRRNVELIPEDEFW